MMWFHIHSSFSAKTMICHHSFILLCGIVHSLILVGESKTIKNITVPHNAPDGYFVTLIPHSLPHCYIETSFTQFPRYFTHLSDGSLVTKGDISNLNGSEIPVIVKTLDSHETTFNLHVHEVSAVFHQNHYIGTIYEHEKVGSEVHIVGHVSLFSQMNATYRILTGEQLFELETEFFGSSSHNNKLLSKQSFDRETQSLFKVRVEGRLSDSQSAETVIEVHVLDINDNAPKFRQPSITVYASPDQTWGSITTLTASDPDLDDQLRYSLEDDSKFFIDPDTGELYSIADILEHGHHVVKAYAMDKAWHQSEAVSVHIIVQSDTLKFKPKISHHISKRAITTIRKTFEIVENRTSFSSLFSVASVQPRPMSSMEVYELVSASVPLFRRPDINGNVYLKAGERLDYEDPTHRKIELVFNRTNPNMPNDYTLVEVTLKVQDLNDEKPVFKNKPIPFLATVSTNPAMGETVYTLLAEDPDQNSQLQYNLESGGEGKFRMVTEQDPITQEMVGKIITTVSGPGQFVLGREYTLVVSAQDIAAGSTQKSDFTLVKVLVGFRPPQLFEDKFHGKVSENSGSGFRVLGEDNSFLVIRAKCFQDILENKVLYELTESDGKISSLFSINSQGYVETLQNFDYEEKPNQYVVNVTAKEIDTGLSSSSQLVVDVMDVNDNSPNFQLSTYTFILPEDTPVGGPAIAPQVMATDRDSGLNGELEYSVSNDNFSIQTTVINNRYIGQIKVAKKLDYDYITDHQYRFNVTVFDKGTIRRTGLATVIIYVTNVNDEAPVFGTGTEHLYASISEEQIVGSVVTIIQATDPDGDNVKYYFTPKLIDRSPFRIDPASGLITLTKALPESVPYYTLNITAYDDGYCCDSNTRLSSNTYILVEIKDTNNNQPQFPNCNYEPRVLENQPIGTFVVKVTAVDDDRGDNGNISYSIVTSPRQSPQFEVDPFTGEVVTAIKFDREAPQGDRGLAVTVKAADQGKPQSLDSHCTFWVNIGDVNDNEPQFDSPSYSTSISESSAVVGRRVFAVRATDKDQDKNADIIYTLTENPDDFFRIEQDTGIIYLNKGLHGRDDVVLTVKAEDQGEFPLNSYSTVTISVTDRTNNPPTWMDDNYEREYTVQETAQIGHVIANMRAMSNTPPPFDGLSFALIDSRENSVQQLGPFRIRQDGDMVILILKGTLDYNEQNTYELRLRVTNQAQTPLSAEIRPVIKVKDMNNEPPEFEGLDPNLSNSYRGSVPENEPPGQTVLKIKAVDNDHDPPNNIVTYSIMEDKNDVYKFFDINSQTGVITTRSQFDREEQSVYYIKVKAIDGTNSDIPNYFPPNSPNSATAQVQVIIADKNDNPPYFVQSEWEIAVPEQRPDTAGRILTVVAKDKDEADQLAYTITEGNIGNVFGIKQKTGDIYVAKTLDYETPPTRYTLTVMVQDGRYENFTTVYINVTDVNDNAPEFTENVYEINDIIEETDPPVPDGHLLVQVYATDKDLSRQNRFRYHLSGDGTGYPNPIFTVEPDTGKIYLRQKLDRDLPEGREVFQFNVIVEDEPDTNQALSGYAYVKVRPMDINDNAPVFREEDLHGSVPEHSNADQSVMTVVATDFDAGDNGTVFYEIDRFGNPPADPNGNLLFKINAETGLIQTKITDSLDREKTAQYFLPIIAKDKGKEQKSSSATVTISISDINDQVPEFVKKIYRVSMSENQIAGPVVTVSATDNDIDENARLTYTLKESDRTFFSIETMPPNAGVLTVFQVVDYEKHKFFNLTVFVQDNNPDHRDVAYIEVTVEDYNDNSPQFYPQVKTIRHLENIPEGTSLWNCSADDADYGINAEFEYFIDRKTDEGRRFTVNSNCEVKVRRGLDGETLDREALEGLPEERYEVRILAVDKGYPRQTGTATLRILVDDVNDNAPEFVLSHPAMVMELLPPPQFVITFKAKDRDTPKYGAPFMFSLPPCEENPTCHDGTLDFTMRFDPNGDRGNGTGTVTAMKTFYRDEQKFYYLPVIMSDMRDKNSLESKTGTSTLTIEIGDENNHPHSDGHKDIFVYKYDFKGVRDELAIGNVYAADLDDWDVVDKYYYFHGPTSMEKYFRIDLENGQIYMNKDTPSGLHEFTAKVWDFRRFTTINATATVAVTVEEITDQAVYSSGSLRFTGMTAEEFITQPSTAEKSPYEKIQELLAEKLNVPQNYVAIFSVMNGKNYEYTEIRYAAHGSPWYPASKLDGIITLDKAEFEAAAGISITMINVDMCLRELCESGGCSNTLIVGDHPNYVNANGTSFIGVATSVQAECKCTAKDFSGKPECSPTYCYNGGHCIKDEWGDVRCVGCRPGFDGPRCQMTKHSFNNGYALFEPFSQCEDSTTSIEFVTEFENGLLFYNGPVTELGRDDPTDYIALSLVDGYPLLQLDHGSGQVTLTLDGRDRTGQRYLQKLNDGRWHHIDIIRKGKEVTMVVDRCDMLNVDSMTDTISDRSPCQVSDKTPGENFFLNVNTLLQLGGRYVEPSFPQTVTSDRFKGCVRNLVHNGQFYDLYTGYYSKGENHENGCPDEDFVCGVNSLDGPKCGPHGVCELTDSINKQYKCTCKPGYRTPGPNSESCNTETTVRDLQENSFMIWSLKPDFLNKDLHPRTTEIQVRFRTRDLDGILFHLPSNSDEFITLELVNGRLKVLYNLGGNDGTSELSLDNAPASNGQWHNLLMRRIGKWFQLKMDGGEGRYYNESWGPEGGDQLISIKMYQIVAGGHVVFSSNPIVNGQDLNKTCITDIRLNDKWFPMINSENGLSDAATLDLEQGVENDCVREDCFNVTCPIGNPISMICYPLWGLHECRCPPGTYPDGYNCLEIDFCLQDNPCFDGSTCVPKPFPDNFTCVCPPGWTGRLCNILQSSVPAKAGITTGFIVIIIICIFLLLVVALVVFLAVRYNKSYDPERYILDVDPDDDIRENVINYNEEGAGEEDQEGYDIHRLRKPDEADTLLKSPYNSLYTDRFQGQEPGERPDIGDFISSRLGDADNDLNAPPHDSVREFVYEGGGSDAGSLSSLQTGSSDNDQDYDYLNDWGPKFSKLANMYGGEEEEL